MRWRASPEYEVSLNTGKTILATAKEYEPLDVLFPETALGTTAGLEKSPRTAILKTIDVTQ